MGINLMSGDFMTEREMIHALVNKLLDIRESDTKKELIFSYHQSKISDSLCFAFYEGNGSREFVGGEMFHAYLNGDLGKSGTSFNKALRIIEEIKNTPDTEPKVNLSISIEKARELGLIA